VVKKAEKAEDKTLLVVSVCRERIEKGLGKGPCFCLRAGSQTEETTGARKAQVFKKKTRKKGKGGFCKWGDPRKETGGTVLLSISTKGVGS